MASAVLVFELCPFRVAGVGHPGNFEICKVTLHEKVQDIEHFFILDVAKTLAGVGENERLFWRSFLQVLV